MTISDYISFPKTFENYKWYKPLLVFIVSFITLLLLTVVVGFVFYLTCGFEFIKLAFSGGYDALNNPLILIFSDLCIIIMIPSLYIASKIVKDRPFSSYSSSRGGWNWKLYFKSLIIPLILVIIYEGIDTFINGPQDISHFSILFLVAIFIFLPLQSIAEEYLFRGFIMQTLGSWFKIPVLVIVIQAVIFSLSHGYNSLGLFGTLVSGILFGFFAWKTNGIEVSSAIHTANNFSKGLFVMLGLQASTSITQLTDVISVIIFYIILGLIMYYVGKKTEWFGEIPETP